MFLYQVSVSTGDILRNFNLSSSTTTPEQERVVDKIINEKDNSTDPATTTEERASEIPSYIEVINSCGPYYEGDCLRVRREPSVESEVVTGLRNGIVLKVGEMVEAEGRQWYKIVFDEWLRHPDRVEGDWYVAADHVQAVDEEILDEPEAGEEGAEKHIVVNLSEQKLYAYEGEELFMEEPVSTGSVGAVTPRGTFTVFYRTPSRYMQGPIPEITEDDYDLPGVPWDLYFTQSGAVIHGAYWHDNFGLNWSHGCINLPPEKAKKLYAWTPEGTQVVVRE